MNTHELAWAAGLFDGEGHIRADLHSRSTTTLCPRIDMPQVDRYVLDRFQRAVDGLGHVYGPYGRRRNPKHSPKYEYIATELEPVQAIMAMLWRWLSPVKRTQATLALLKTRAMYRTAPGRPKTRTHCKNGHLRENMYIVVGRGGYTYRCCRPCRREAVAKSRRIKKLARAMLTA